MNPDLEAEHSWLFRKLWLIHERERFLFLGLYERYKEQLEEVTGRSLDEYLEPFDLIPPDELSEEIDPEGYLIDQFREAERHEAGLVAAVSIEWEEAGMAMVCELYRQHGQEMAKLAVQEMEHDPRTARDAFEAVIDIFYDGTPGDGHSIMAEFDNDRLLWMHNLHLHIPSWDEAGVRQCDMLDGIQAWLQGLLSGLPGHYEYSHLAENERLYGIISHTHPTPEIIRNLRARVNW